MEVHLYTEEEAICITAVNEDSKWRLGSVFPFGRSRFLLEFGKEKNKYIIYQLKVGPYGEIPWPRP